LTKIVVGVNAPSSDWNVARKIKASVMQFWFADVISDIQVTEKMYQSERILVIGGPISNSVSQRLNDEILHYTWYTWDSSGSGFKDSQGNDLGLTVIKTYRNITAIWGWNAPDTIVCGDVFISQESWKAPAAIAGVCGIGALLYFGLRKKKR